MKSFIRTPFIDPLKAIAAQLIVLHHLAFYGPMSDVLYDKAPGLVDWFYDYARMAVQIFLVVGGFLAAMALTPDSRPRPVRPIRQLARRYLRLVPPYVGALLIAIAAAAIARQLMQHDSIPDAPSFGQFLSHVFLLHDVLDQNALSVGVWYVAIDFQLFSIMLACVWLTQLVTPQSAQLRVAPNAVLLPLLVGMLALFSLLHVNRLDEWDNWGAYFFGAYALGALAYWAANARSAAWMLVPLLCGVVAVLVEPRPRIGLATITALTLGLAHRYRHLASGPDHKLVRLLGQSSYALFLLHFPVFMIVNAIVHRFAPGELWPSVVGLVVTWALSNVAGMLYHLHVERRIGNWPHRSLA